MMSTQCCPKYQNYKDAMAFSTANNIVKNIRVTLSIYPDLCLLDPKGNFRLDLFKLLNTYVDLTACNTQIIGTKTALLE